ncbi:helix-turn-helix domain-containing protein [Hufsiella ginkgonis]|uniref:Helix-turn-helix domain-containing protein n=1 Tax=Hufsiella ginkgonis TaxID=2695274 RepID=A0A7K1XU65_9SPHI|nr:helix-turn-helix domain-containing protein [Hufsiella ginkgonis]MXV14348.1 helix-turn-helix domain-containing protein [Hufsiella ginkgonis]
MPAIEFLTREDMEQFKNELLTELRRLGVHPGKKPEFKEWLKSYEVRKLLGISPGTLQTLRINGTLPYTKIGGLMYYKHEDIRKLLESNYRQ